MHIAVDGGQTGTRVALVQHGRVVATEEGAGFSYRPGEDPVETSVTAFTEIWARLPDAEVERVWMGLTGSPSQPVIRRQLAMRILALTGARQVSVGGDVVTAHAGALGGADGVVVAVGTGTVCLAAVGGRLAVVDGHGAHLGDDGSGYAVGRAGLRAALRDLDGRGPQTDLTRVVLDRYGSRDGLLQAVYLSNTTISDIAAFAPAVADVARTGDPVATQVWQVAGETLADTVAAGIRRVTDPDRPGSVPVSWTGRLMITELRSPFQAALARICPAARIVEPAGSGLTGAVLLTGRPTHSYGDLVDTVTTTDIPTTTPGEPPP
ncbi:MAG: N-acetylglucosamine kinase [Propionibacteriaceae bacterium]